MSMDYEKALEKARNIYFASEDKEILKTLEVIFPELKDGEKIRKMLIRIYKKADMGGEIFGEGITYKQVIAWLEKQGEQKPAWSEEDKETIRHIRCYLNEYGNWLSDKNEEKSQSIYKACDWLKSLKDRVQPQQKQEWNAQDEAFLGDAIYAAKNTYSENCGQEELIDWLKSLKPQNHWKPSEEQMQALFEAKLASINNREYFLGLLYEDLKKL